MSYDPNEFARLTAEILAKHSPRDVAEMREIVLALQRAAGRIDRLHKRAPALADMAISTLESVCAVYRARQEGD